MKTADTSFPGHSSSPPVTVDEGSVRASIRSLVQQQPFAVLCTQGSGQPYGSVVAYTMNDALDTAVFATGRATRKYNLLTECDRVALVVDTRSAHPGELMSVEAITATGRARELQEAERPPWAAALVTRHPQLKTFVDSPSTAIFTIEISRYLYVTRFQEVHHWAPCTDQGVG
ncbi:MAG: pyridoxamine 5'-phosphate oxidase family protein [Anaerolineae bacterium]|nr:pyridoxamine 5'-phosphate oxidase family protein [Anaerolineae bacterium]